MPTTHDPDLDVLVVGAGPVGLAAACELSRQGLRCATIDRSLEPSCTSKALGVQARTLEVFDAMGIADEAVLAGRRLTGIDAYADGERLFHLDLQDIAAEARARGWIDPVVVAPLAERPASLPADLPVILDPSRAAHRRYGAGAECLYLVRPDATVAYRSRPASAATLGAFLDRVQG